MFFIKLCKNDSVLYCTWYFYIRLDIFFNSNSVAIDEKCDNLVTEMKNLIHSTCIYIHIYLQVCILK